MADVSKLTIASGTYDIKDAAARSDISNMKNAGITTSYLADGSVTKNKLAAGASYVNRNFILIGDSFGGGVDGNNNTSTVSGGGWIQRFRDTVSGKSNVYNSQTPMTGAYGFASSRPFLDVLKDAQTNITDVNTITDIVVLGGTNDQGHESSIESAISAFCSYCKTTFKNADIVIGVLGSACAGLQLNIVPKYKTCEKYGAIYSNDLSGLFCDGQYIGADGTHLNLSGYVFYQPMINNFILNKGVSKWTQNVVVTCSTVSPFAPANMNITFTITENYSSMFFGLAGLNLNLTDYVPMDAGNINMQMLSYPSTVLRLRDENSVVLCGMEIVRKGTSPYGEKIMRLLSVYNSNSKIYVVSRAQVAPTDPDYIAGFISLIPGAYRF